MQVNSNTGFSGNQAGSTNYGAAEYRVGWVNPRTASPNKEQISEFSANQPGSVPALLQLFNSMQVLAQSLSNFAGPNQTSDHHGYQTQAQHARTTLNDLVRQNISDPQTQAQYEQAVHEVFDYFGTTRTPQQTLLANQRVTNKLAEVGLRGATIQSVMRLVKDWGQLTSGQRLTQGGVIGTRVLQDLGVLSPQQGTRFTAAAGALSQLGNPNLSGSDRALVLANAAAELYRTPFTGTTAIPETVNGQQVLGSTTTADGSPGFFLEDGSVIARSDLNQSHNIGLLLQAASTLTSDASGADKALSLAQLGISGAVANDLLSQTQAGGIGALLAAVQGARNWSEMDEAQRFSTVVQTANLAIPALAGISGGSSVAASGAAAGLGSSVLSKLSGVLGIAMGAKQAVDVLGAVDDLPRSQAVKFGAMGLGSAGAAIGAGVATVSGVAAGVSLGATLGSTVPIVGTAIGAVVGAAIGALAGIFGSGKGTGQKMRDSWRDAMEKGGFAQKIDGSHHVTLADGSLYNIGKDGGHKLANVDGTERRTVEIDHSNTFAAETIPDAHLFAIATGLDPTSNRDHGLFDGATAQAWNAAVSNASTPEQFRENLRAMMASGGVKPEELATKLEVLRVTNKITDQEHQVYISRLNQLFGSEVKQNDRAGMHQSLVQHLSSKGALSESETELLRSLTDPIRYEEGLEKLGKRLQPQGVR